MGYVLNIYADYCSLRFTEDLGPDLVPANAGVCPNLRSNQLLLILRLQTNAPELQTPTSVRLQVGGRR